MQHRPQPGVGAVAVTDGTHIPDDHPRAHSLHTRARLQAAVEAGLVHGTGLIAHGRGEAFDYLLGEQTPPEARFAIEAAARALHAARNPVLSLNGNVVALAGPACVALRAALPRLKLEVNLFHRTPERVAKLIAAMEAAGAAPGSVLGSRPDARIPGLASDRAQCTQAGIGSADVILVPLEDGDRCSALKAMGKTVITIDLNPLSRTARTADITIVDELTRALPLLAEALSDRSQTRSGSGKRGGDGPIGVVGDTEGDGHSIGAGGDDDAATRFDNEANLAAVRHRMAAGLE
jgi:4-phosphopantoate---beta-alanine ligase